MCSFRRLADSIYFEAAPANRSEEHTSELQSQSNLVCRLIIAEEHTSELQSQSNLVCRLLLEKKQRHSVLRLQHDSLPSRRAYSPGGYGDETRTSPGIAEMIQT